LRLGAVVGTDVAPTLAGLLLFGRSESLERLVPQSRISLTRYSGIDTNAPSIEHIVLHGNLTQLFDGAMRFITRYVDLWDARPPRSSAVLELGHPVPPRANYSRAVTVEGLKNMLVHRDYSIVSTDARVLVFDDRIDLVNPYRTNGTTKRAVEYGAISRLNPR